MFWLASLRFVSQAWLPHAQEWTYTHADSDNADMEYTQAMKHEEGKTTSWTY